MYWESGEFWAPGDQVASGDDVERRLLAADRLCPDGRALLEVLSVLAGDQPPAVVARVAGVPEPARALDLLRGLGLVVSADGPRRPARIALARESDGRFLRARLSPTRWRALHRAAAEVLDPRPALVHRALAADRPDPDLAAALERAAVDAPAPDDETGVPTRQLLVWAADLSTDRAERDRRLLLAALHDVYGEELGDADLWARVEALPPSPLRSCALAGRALLEHRLGAAADHLRAARRSLAAGHADARATAAVETVRAALACRTARGGAAVEAATAALEAASRDVVQLRTARRLLLTGRSYADGPREVLRSLPGYLAGSGGLLLVRGECRVLAGDLTGGAGDLADLARRREIQPGHPDRLRALERLAIAHFLLGSWPEADAAVDALDAAGGVSAGRALRAMFSAVRAPDVAPRRGAWASANRRPPGSADPDRLAIATWADVIALLAHRHHPAILAAMTWLTAGATELADAPAKFAPLWLPVYAEAAIEVATGAAAGAALAQLRACAERTPYLAVTCHRLTGRAAEQRHDLAAAEAAYQAGLQAVAAGPPAPPLHRAQLRHAYGRFLCAHGRTAAGLGWLERAEDDFAALGALAFARSSAQDRAAATRGPSPGQDAVLTERETMVAQLVTTGLTNRQVSEKLLISVKAVEYHLGKIYRKLGVRRRSELASRWPS
ncbi:LuxR C-terminal-related transcriptional regulator [Kitasatospora sp. NPDC052896]|uniref:helix-turn-helix transcriptional regulator n=1 Tax=Kitasatospora sp. NPDC052896 TaxID=3364061 RepID=UPI0037C79CE4